MNTAQRYAVCGLTLAMAIGLQACGHQNDQGQQASSPAIASTDSGPLTDFKITNYGPTSTKAGVVFNKQPNGGSAIWIRVSRSMEGSVATIDFDGTKLTGIIVGNLVTAAVPSSLYAKPGNYPVHVIEKRGASVAQSSDVTFSVE